ncbi:hypothetical protein GGI07_002977 [Coemansia sp. Benny D115]|nr:hypothetical protein GGI07_002977 [Coemansia sp. Benny D115]
MDKRADASSKAASRSSKKSTSSGTRTSPAASNADISSDNVSAAAKKDLAMQGAFSSAADLHTAPTTRHSMAIAGSNGNGGLGLRATSVHTAEDASVYSGRSAVGSISGESKPPSQKSTAMGIVKRLRRLSSAAIGSKVNRLFSRSSNPSQDSLLLSGPSSPTPTHQSSGAIPLSPGIPNGSTSGSSFGSVSGSVDIQRSRTPGNFGLTGAYSGNPAAEWRASNAHNLPPLPTKPLASRRTRAMTEIAPLAIKTRIESQESESSENTGDSPSSVKMAPSRAKAINSPLVASPLSRKSFHALHAQSISDENMDAEETRAQEIVKSAVEGNVSLPGSQVSPPALGRSATTPKMLRVSSGASVDQHRPAMPHRLSYQYNDDYSADGVASDTPSPPEKAASRSPSHASSSEARAAPSMQRRRTALASLGWSEQSSGSESNVPQDRDTRPPSTNAPSRASTPGGTAAALHRLQSGATHGKESPANLLAAFQLHSRVSSGLFRQSSPGASARSSTSLNSDSVQSWSSAMVAGVEVDMDDEKDSGPARQNDVLLPGAQRRTNRSSLAVAGGVNERANSETSMYSPAWGPPLPGQSTLFDSSIMDWRRHSQDESATFYSHSQSSSTTAPAMPAAMPASIYTRGGSALADDTSTQDGEDGMQSASSEPPFQRYNSEPLEYDAGSLTSLTGLPASTSGSVNGMQSYPIHPASSLPVTSQLARPRGGSHLVHLARAATTNAIRLKEKNSAAPIESGSATSASIALPRSSVSTAIGPTSARSGHGSAPEPSNMDFAIERGQIQPRMRATSASSQPFGASSGKPLPAGGPDGVGYSTSAGSSQQPGNALSRSTGAGASTGSGANTGAGPGSISSYMHASRPPSSMSVYTMSPVSSTMGDEGQHGYYSHSQSFTPQMWPPSVYRSSPDRSSSVDGQVSGVASAGMYTPSSTSSPPPFSHQYHHHQHHQHHHHNNSNGGGGSQSGHQLRLNTSSVQRSASGHSVSSGISELLEPSSVSQVRKDVLWQILVVSKSRADTEIDKIMRQWKEAENGAVICTLDSDSKPGVGDEDAIILKVKRGHRRSNSDIKRADGDKNAFRRRVLELAHLIRNTSVSELSNDVVTRNITEQLYGLLTEHRARFVSDANVGTLIVDILYQFSAVSQTVSQLAMPLTVFTGGARHAMSGEASPAISQFPSPQLVPDSSLSRSGSSALPPLSSALSSQYELAGMRGASAPHVMVRDNSESSVSGHIGSTSPSLSAHRAHPSALELSEYRIGRTGSEASYPSVSASGRMRPLDSASCLSSPHMLPATAHSSTASLLSLLAPVHSGGNSANGSLGRSVGTQQPQQHQRQRMYFPTTASASQPIRQTMELPDSESETSARPSLDDSQMRPALNRHASKLSISSDATDTQTQSHKKSVRASIQPHHFFNHFARLQQQQQQQQDELDQTEQGRLRSKQRKTSENKDSAEAASLVSSAKDGDDSGLQMTPKRALRPMTMYLSSSGGLMRRVSESISRQEKLASLLSQDMSGGESMPNSPCETPVRQFMEPEPQSAVQPPRAELGTIPEAKHGSDSGTQDAGSQRASLVGDAESIVATEPKDQTASPDRLATSPRESFTSQILQDVDDQKSEDQQPEADTAEAQVVDSDIEVASAAPVLDEDEMVVCRLCERSFHRADLNLHSDVCILEQTRGMKLDEVNQRIKRLRDSVAKRLGDLRKARRWDKVAIRESERVIRIAERAIVWPEGDSQHELIVAKAKFTKYIEKLETITGSNASVVSPGGGLGEQQGTTGSQAFSIAASASRLPRADVETIWLAKKLLARIQDKFTIIEEFDKEFSRLERQEALIRQAESANAVAKEDSEADADIEPDSVVVPDPVQPGSAQYLYLPTWSQLAQHTGQRSPAASERTSMDFNNSQSESGSATPDVSGSHALGIGKGFGITSRRHSRHSRPGRRSLSRSARPTPDLTDVDSPPVTSASPSSGGSGSRKFVSLFAALFRNNTTGFGKSKDHSGPSILRRKNTSSSAIPGTGLPTMNRSSSALRRQSQNKSSAQLNISAPISATPIGTGSGSGGDTASIAAASMAPQSSASGEALSAVVEATATPANSTINPSDVPLSSPVTRQRNNSQLSTMRATADLATKVQRMPSIEDFDFVKPISRGAFGRVYLTRKKATKDLYAIKVMRKKDMINKNMVTQALAERRALSLLSTEWVVQLYYAFHSSKHLFLVMEYLVGGDLAGLLRVWGVMEQDAAQFYIAEIACAIDYLHRNSIVHRDIKPDNVILASDGHIKLTDFGLSQVAVRGSAAENKALLEGSDGNSAADSPSPNSTPLGEAEALGRVPDKSEDYVNAAIAQAGRSMQTPALDAGNAQAGKALPQSKRAHARKSTRSFLGTPDYLAPELLLGAGNGLAVDWWALGVCLFEFVCGYPPFTDQSPEAIFRNILNHAIDWPEEEGYVSEEAAELIKALLSPDPATRAHWKDIKAARLYEGWDMSQIRQMEPPFVPQPDDDVDTSYFEPCQRTEIQRLSNATFLQVDIPKRPPATPRQQSARATEILPSPDGTKSGQQLTDPDGSQRGSSQRRGSRRGRSASGSLSVRSGPATQSSGVGQLKKLFSDLAADETESDANQSLNGTKEEGMVSAATPTADRADGSSEYQASMAPSAGSTSSSDKYSFTEVISTTDARDERLQGIGSGSGSVMAMVNGSGDGGGSSVAETNSMASDGDNGGQSGDDDDDDPERVFEDFAYKNLALLSHVNKGVSSSPGQGISIPEKPSHSNSVAASPPVISHSHRPSIHSTTASIMVRESPINAYDTNNNGSQYSGTENPN